MVFHQHMYTLNFYTIISPDQGPRESLYKFADKVLVSCGGGWNAVL